MNAEVGDEKGGEDPTVNLLNEKVANLLGKEEAIFLPSGTMCNAIASHVFCGRGDEIILHHTAHTRMFETGGPAALSSAMLHTVDGERGIFTGEQVINAIRPDDPHFPKSRLLWVEQTSNLAGGTIWSLEEIRDVCEVAREGKLVCHMDGARLMNAVAATGISACLFAEPFDSVWIDFSKGLGAPLGAGLAGSKSFIKEAIRRKFLMGGAMRQAGIVAAAALYALENNIERLAEDHSNARILYDGIRDVDGLLVREPETNMVFISLPDDGITAHQFNEYLRKHGMRVSVIGRSLMRAVTHLDISTNDVHEAISIVKHTARECL